MYITFTCPAELFKKSLTPLIAYGIYMINYLHHLTVSDSEHEIMYNIMCNSYLVQLFFFSISLLTLTNRFLK